jgi:hypothetical protein
MFDDDHLVLAYDIHTPPNAHKLACVFLVMALGVMFDLNRQPCKSIIVIQADKQSTRGERDCSYWEEHVCQQWDSSIPHQLLYKLYISVGLIS